MDRLMTEAQEHRGGVSTLTRHKCYSAYNSDQVRPNKYTVSMDWNTACFAHLPAMLQHARQDKKDGTGDKTYKDSNIVEILYLPRIGDLFSENVQGLTDSLDYLTDIFKFMGVTESPAQVLIEGWAFNLDRSGQWNVAVCSLIRYLSESQHRVEAYLYMRRTLKLTALKALFICHFIERCGGLWRRNLSPGGHTLLRATTARFSQFPKFVKWRERDTGKSILESCEYHGVNVMFGHTNDWKEVHGPDGVRTFMYNLDQPYTDEHLKEFSKLLKQPRGKKDEDTDSKPTRVRKSVRPDKAPVYLGPGDVKVVRSGPVHGGVRRRSEPLLIQAAPPDIINPFERSRRAKPIPRGKKA